MEGRLRQFGRDIFAGSVGAFWTAQMAMYGPGAKFMFYSAAAVLFVSGALFAGLQCGQRK